MSHEKSSNYVAGLLDSIGGFYVVKRKTKKYIYFKINIANKKINDIIYKFLTDRLKIKVRDWNGSLNITNTDSIQKLTMFMQNHCIRDDYKNLLIKYSFEVDKSIQ